MNFLVDAQLPRRFAYWLQNHGHDAVHTLDLPAGNRTADHEITSIADAQGRIVVTKDDDFVESYILMGRPRRLLLISLGEYLQCGTGAHLVRKPGWDCFGL